MSTELAFEILVYGALVPAAVAIGALWIARRVLPPTSSSRHAAALAFAGGFCAGYALLPEWAPWSPSRHWHWLPYLAAAAAVTGPIAVAAGVSRPERWLLCLLSAIVAAWLLVPTWASLQPPRTTWVPLLAGYLFLLAALLDDLPDRVPGPMLRGVLFVVAATAAAVIADRVSISQARVAGLAAGALGGIAVGSGRRGNGVQLRGLAPAFAIVVGGGAFAGCIDPPKPLYGLLLAPAVPLALWVCAVGPLRRLGAKAAVVQAIAVAIALAGALALVYGDGAEAS
ncbi:MAG: hypothetical protein WD069_08250 [Planctomycetales bacterium]